MPSTVFVDSHAQLGGAERYLLQILDHAGPNAVRTVVTLHDGPLVERLAARGLEVSVISAAGKSGVPLGAWRLRRLLGPHSPDVVVANGVKAALVCGLATIGLRSRVVWRKCDDSYDGPAARAVARMCTAVVGVSHHALTPFHGRLKTKTMVVYNGVRPLQVDRTQMRTSLLQLIGRGHGVRILVVIGRLCRQKGQAEVVEILPEVRRRSGQDVVAVFLGAPDRYEPSYAVRLRERAEELSVAEHAIFLGDMDDARSLVAGSDIAVVPSETEGFGIAAVEAMAAGVPVVAYASASLPEVIGDGGWLVGERDRAALADAVVAVLEDAVLADCLARRGRERAVEQFSNDAALDSFWRALEDVGR
jgi:glycosyltransferase involved in cell wall biosynthesis